MSSTRDQSGRAPDAGAGRGWQRPVAWVVGIFGGLVPVVAILGVLAFVVTYAQAHVPAPGDIKQSQVATIVNADGQEIGRIVPPEGNRTDVKIEDIPKSMQDAVIAAEDREFRSNAGFSVRGISRAVLGKLTNNEGAGGGSTITQQYVKNALVGDEHSYKRKFNELAIATKMSTEWSKDDILAAYLNTIYFGRGAYGISAASQAYFRKPVQDLTVSESALLAAVIRSPSYYDPEINPEAAQARWEYVLDGMVEIGALAPTDRAAEVFPKVAPPPAAGSNETTGPNGLIQRQVLAELDEVGITEQQVRTEGLKITTTIDPKVQKSVVDAAKEKLEGEPEDLRTAIVSINPATGGVSGYFGGYDAQGWDYAQAGLQTGSSFKVFALVAALEQDIPLSQSYSSDPYSGPGGLTVQNAGGDSCGTCNLATATKMSLNTVFYRLMMDLRNGAEDVADAAHRAGIAESFGNIEHTLQESNGGVEGGVVLGQYASRVIDMASAYATLAASGIYREPYFVQKVENSTGDVLFEKGDTSGERVLEAKVADNVTAALEPVAAYSNGNSLYDSSLGARPSASKTGTAQLGDTGSNKDAWMVGYTPQLSTAVWLGTDEGTALRNYAGASIYGSMLPAQIWRQAMNGALAGDPIENFPEPEAIGGVAGVPYEPPPTTYSPPTSETDTTRPERPRLPGEGADGNLTIAPGVTIPLPGAANPGTREEDTDPPTDTSPPSDDSDTGGGETPEPPIG